MLNGGWGWKPEGLELIQLRTGGSVRTKLIGIQRKKRDEIFRKIVFLLLRFQGLREGSGLTTKFPVSVTLSSRIENVNHYLYKRPGPRILGKYHFTEEPHILH